MRSAAAGRALRERPDPEWVASPCPVSGERCYQLAFTLRRKLIELVEKGHLQEVRGGLRAVAPVLEHADNLKIVMGAIRMFERTAGELRASDAR